MPMPMPSCPNAGSRLLRPPAAGRGRMNYAAVVGGCLSGRAAPYFRAPPDNGIATEAGRCSTYRRQDAVQTNPATSIARINPCHLRGHGAIEFRLRLSAETLSRDNPKNLRSSLILSN